VGALDGASPSSKFIADLTRPPLYAVRMEATADQTFTAGTTSTVIYDIDAYDEGTLRSDTSEAEDRVKIPADGMYEVGWGMRFNGTNNALYFLIEAVVGEDVTEVTRIRVETSTDHRDEIHYYLRSDQELRARVENGSGSDYNSVVARGNIYLSAWLVQEP
jgi:hypothetical protein